MNPSSIGVLLLVEDNDDDVLLIRETIQDANFAQRIFIVTDGEQAMEFLRKDGQYKEVPVPNIIILDIRMPKKDGFKVLREIKENPGLCHIPVIILTASDKEKDMMKSYEKGASSYIVKPAEHAKFCDMIRHMVFYWKSVASIPAAPDPSA